MADQDDRGDLSRGPFPDLPAEIAARVAAVKAGSAVERLEIGRSKIGIQNTPRAKTELAKLDSDEISPAEMRVLVLLAEGLTNDEIAPRVFLSRETVKAHVRHMLARCGCKSRAQLAYRWGRGEIAVAEVSGGTKTLLQPATR